MPRIMIVDDDRDMRVLLTRHVQKMGYEVVGAAIRGEESFSMAQRVNPDVILMDIMMPGDLDGISAAEIIKEQLDIPVIFLTAHPEDDMLQRVRQADPFGYIMKPVQRSELQVAIQIAIHKKSIDRRMRESEANYRRIVESTSAGLWHLDLHGRTLFVNRAMAKMLGADEEEMLGEAMDGFLDEASRRLVASLGPSEAMGPSGPLALRLIGKDGSSRVAMGIVDPLKNAAGQVCGTLVTVTDSIHVPGSGALDLLSDSQQAYLLESLPLILFASSPSEGLPSRWMAGRAEELTGYDAADFLRIRDLWLRRIHEEDRSRVEDALGALYARGAVQVSYRWQHLDGPFVSIQDCLTLARDHQGQPWEIVGVRLVTDLIPS